jgi:lipopolysaccharide export system protein LptA
MSPFKALLFTTLLLSSSLSAMTEDSNQAIVVESDSAERNEKTGLTHYSGNVFIRQGSMAIDADKVTVHYQDNRVNKIVCTGNPASYQQLSNNGGTVLARADTIEYLPIEKVVNLKTDASLSRNGTLIKGDTINYDLSKGTWKAKGDNKSNQKRIQLVIPPPQQTSNSEEIVEPDIVKEAKSP